MAPVYINYYPNDNISAEYHDKLYLEECSHQQKTDLLRVVENVDKYDDKFKCDFKVLLISGIYNIADSVFEETLNINDEIIETKSYFIKSNKMTLNKLIEQLNLHFKLVKFELDAGMNDDLFSGSIKIQEM